MIDFAACSDDFHRVKGVRDTSDRPLAKMRLAGGKKPQENEDDDSESTSKVLWD